MKYNIPKDLLYSEEHEWVRFVNNHVVMGISDHAQDALGDVVYVELPEVGAEISKGAAIGVVESVKAVSDIYAPLSGIVKKVNQQAIDEPQIVNQDPYKDGFLIEIEILNENEKKELLSPNDYEKLLIDLEKQ